MRLPVSAPRAHELALFEPDPEKTTVAFENGVLRVNVGKPAELVAEKMTIPVSKAN